MGNVSARASSFRFMLAMVSHHVQRHEHLINESRVDCEWDVQKREGSEIRYIAEDDYKIAKMHIQRRQSLIRPKFPSSFDQMLFSC